MLKYSKDIRSVYVTSTQWNSAKLLQDYWTPNLLQVLKDLEAAKIEVFISLYENDNWDSTESIFNQFRHTLGTLGTANRITLDNNSHEYIEFWMATHCLLYLDASNTLRSQCEE